MCGWRRALLRSNLSSAKIIDALKMKGAWGYAQVFFIIYILSFLGAKKT